MTSTPQTQTSEPTTTDLWADRSTAFTALVSGTEAWDAPSPCEGWTAGDVVRHVIDTEREFLEGRGFPIASAGTGDPAADWAAHLAEVDRLVATDGVMDLAYDGFFGPTTIGATLADFYGWDLAIHGWDLARATGQRWSVTDTQAQSLMATADGWGDALHSEGICGPELPIADSAPIQDRLLARLGRDPHWTP